MSFPRYPKYKDSGVEWLGDVPDHWDVIRLKNVLKQRITDGPHTTPVFVDEGVRFLSVDGIQDGELQFDGCRFISEADHAEYRTKALPRRNDLLMGKAASTGKIARVKVDFEFSIWSPLALIRFDNAVSNATYFEQSLKSPIAQAQIDNFCTANTQKNISMEDIPRLILTRPPLEEQATIAVFLDRETAKIDGLVAEQGRLIGLLKEKRQAVISHAVTKGLNPDAPMKPSGIEWLGNVPSHWEVTRLGRICSEINDINHVMPTAVEFGVPFLSAKDLLDDGTLNFTTDIKMISEDDFAKLSSKICPRRGDIIYSRIGACLGKARLVETDDRFLISYSCCVVRVIDTIASRHFIQHLLDGEMILTEARMRTQGIGVPDLGLGEIGRFPVPLPPMKEQEAIAEYLDKEASELENLTAEAERAIDLLQERRTALISAAVTGKIDVRGLVDLEAK